jgi:hypothetical protein
MNLGGMEWGGEEGGESVLVDHMVHNIGKERGHHAGNFSGGASTAPIVARHGNVLNDVVVRLDDVL